MKKLWFFLLVLCFLFVFSACRETEPEYGPDTEAGSLLTSETETNALKPIPLPTYPFPTTEPDTTTEPPATEPPVTEPPVTEPPVTEPPVTEEPGTEPPVTEPPVTEPPATEPPVTEPPVTEPPVTEPPVTEEPGTEEPGTDSDLPRSYLIQGITPICQNPEYPTGCESISAVTLLHFLGYRVDPEDFISQHLPMGNFYYRNGKRYGPDPYKVFCGDPRNSSSYGCMSPVIVTALNSYLTGDADVVSLDGSTLSELCAYVAQDLPVLVWVTMDMLPSFPGNTWYLEDGTLFQWTSREHCMVLVGYDETSYYFSDPIAGQIVSYPKALCEMRYGEMGCQAVTVIPNPVEPM